MFSPPKEEDIVRLEVVPEGIEVVEEDTTQPVEEDITLPVEEDITQPAEEGITQLVEDVTLESCVTTVTSMVIQVHCVE